MSRGEILRTRRLVLRRLGVRDAAFIKELVNEPAWLKFIGDKGVRTLEDARRYIKKGPAAMYSRLGFGLYLIELRKSGVPLGICGFVKRPELPDADLGFALLRRFWRRGYALESARAVVAYGHERLGLERLLAITSSGNRPSIRLLKKLGFQGEGTLRLAPERPKIRLFVRRSRKSAQAGAGSKFPGR